MSCLHRVKSRSNSITYRRTRVRRFSLSISVSIGIITHTNTVLCQMKDLEKVEMDDGKHTKRRSRKKKKPSAEEQRKRKRKKRQESTTKHLIHTGMNGSNSQLHLPDCTQAADILARCSTQVRQQLVSETWQKQLRSYRKNLFPVWLNQLRAGFGVLLCGVGSKLQLLKDFMEQSLSKDPRSAVVEIHGFRDGFKLSALLDALTSQVLDVEVSDEKGNANLRKAATGGRVKSSTKHRRLIKDAVGMEALRRSSSSKQKVSLENDMILRRCRAVASLFSSSADPSNDNDEYKNKLPQHLHLVIHSIDGVALQDSLSQSGLSILAGTFVPIYTTFYQSHPQTQKNNNKQAQKEFMSSHRWIISTVR